MKENRKRDNIFKQTLIMTKFVNVKEDWINLRILIFRRLNFECLRILVSALAEDRKPCGRIRTSKSQANISVNNANEKQNCTGKGTENATRISK